MEKREMRIDKIDVWSVMRISALFGLITGVIIGVFYAIIFGLMYGLLSGMFMLIISPIVYTIISALSGVIYAWLYNVCSINCGGIKINYSEVKEKITTHPECRGYYK